MAGSSRRRSAAGAGRLEAPRHYAAGGG